MGDVRRENCRGGIFQVRLFGRVCPGRNGIFPAKFFLWNECPGGIFPGWEGPGENCADLIQDCTSLRVAVMVCHHG